MGHHEGHVEEGAAASPEAGASGAMRLAEGAALLRGFATEFDDRIFREIRTIEAQSPFRRMQTRRGHTMSVAMTNCGDVGWVSDRSGYRYDPVDPLTARPWPPMPPRLSTFASAAAESCGFSDFSADVCLINRFSPKARLSLHQDKDERDYRMPIVSVSLGLPATFLLGTERRRDTPRRIVLESGDVVVFGGASRRVYHGVAPLARGHHPLAGGARFNLTFRKAL